MKTVKLITAIFFILSLLIHSPKISVADTLPGSPGQIPALEINSDGTLTYIHILLNGNRYVIVCDGATILAVYPEG